MRKRIALSGLLVCFMVSSVSGVAMAKGPKKDKIRDIPPGQAKAAGERAIGKGLVKNGKLRDGRIDLDLPVQSRERITGPAEKATGEIGYIAGNLFRELEFNAHEENGDCRVSWNVEGEWVLSLGDNETEGLTEANDTHGMTVSSQDEDGVLTGSGGYPPAMPYSQGWVLVSSYVEGDGVNLEMDYNATDYGVVLEGALDGNGTMAGEWWSTSSHSGNWTSVSGEAGRLVVDCEGKGVLYYNDESGGWYDVEVQYVNVDGDTAWFAGPVVSASDSGWTSQWFFGKVMDGGEPAAGVDQVWGSFVTMEEAETGVAEMLDPSNGPFPVDMGNLQVHMY